MPAGIVKLGQSPVADRVGLADLAHGPNRIHEKSRPLPPYLTGGPLAPWRHISPWDWAFGGNSLEQATDLWRYAALAVPSVILTAIGLVAVTRRDISGA